MRFLNAIELYKSYNLILVLFFISSILTLNISFNFLGGIGYHFLDEYIIRYLTSGYTIAHKLTINYLPGGIFQHLINNFSKYINYVLISAVFYLIYKNTWLRNQRYIYPILMLSFLYGDYVTPLAAILLYGYNHKRWISDVGAILISLSDPILLIPLLLFKSNKTSNLVKKFFLIPILILGIYISPSYSLFSVFPIFTIHNLLLTLSGLIIYYTSYPRKIHQVILTFILMPFTYNSGYTLLTSNEYFLKSQNISKNLSLLVILLLSSSWAYQIYIIGNESSSSISEIYNPSLDEFINNVIPNNATVILATDDTYINKILVKKNCFLIPYQDSMTWNWSDRKDIESKLNTMINFSYKYDAKYMVLIRGSELPYWVSTYQYKEYKYGLVYPENKFVIILENRGLYTNLGPYYISEIYNSSNSLLPYLFKVWTENRINYTYNGQLKINSSSNFIVYISFKIPDNIDRLENYLLLSLEGESNSINSSLINSLEIYGYDGNTLASLWVRTNISKNLNLVLEDINLTRYPYLTLKIDASGFVRIREIALESKSSSSPYTLKIENGSVEVKNNLNSYLRLDTLYPSFKEGSGDYSPKGLRQFELDNGYIKNALEYYIVFIVIFILVSLIIKENQNEYERDNLDKMNDRSTLLILPILPLLYDLIYYPHLLQINWIGDAPLIFSTIIFYMILYVIRKDIRYNDNTGILIVSIPIITLLNQVLIEYTFKRLQYTDQWVINSYISLINLFTTFLLYIAIFISIYPFIYRENRRIVTVGFLTPIAYIGLIEIIYYMNLSHSFLEQYISIFPFINGFISTKLLNLIGFKTNISPYNYGTILEVYKNGKVLDVAIGWPCSGITGMFLYSSFMVVEFIYLRKMGYIMSRKTILITYSIGLITVFVLNIVRITSIILLAIYVNYGISKLFHSIIYELIFFLWIVVYIYLVERLTVKRSLK